jgi:galactokinase
MLEVNKLKLDDVQYRRARHVIGEIERTVIAAEKIAAGDWDTVGELMYASHDSLRDDYEVSCVELDALVEAARNLGKTHGVIGSRMTGGGFGGSTVTLVRSDKASAIAAAICDEYLKRTGIKATAFATPPAQGAHVIASPA